MFSENIEWVSCLYKETTSLYNGYIEIGFKSCYNQVTISSHSQRNYLMTHQQDIFAHRYTIMRSIGQGAMGVVYEAHDRLTDEIIALKRLHPKGKNLYDTATLSESLAREFHILASLKHPNIITVKDFGFDKDNTPYFTMSLITAPQDILTATQGLSLERKISFLLDILQGIWYLHRQKLVHRDLKPSNVVIDEQNQLRVLDFGLSSPEASASGVAGTLAYLAPEVLRSEQASIGSDLYSFGVIAYEVLAETNLYEESSISSIIRKILYTPPNIEKLTAPTALQLVIQRLLLKNPQDRYTDARQVILALCDAVNLPHPNDLAVRDSFLKTARFVGRQDEFAQLRNGLRDTQEKQGSSWVISGESGVGKSRLIQELRIQAMVEGYQVLTGRGVENGGLFRVFRDILAPLLLSTPVTTHQTALLSSVVPDAPRLTKHDISTFPKDQEGQIDTIIKDIILQQNQPMLIILEDIHWATESLALIRDIQKAIYNRPIMLVCTYRSDEDPYLYGKLSSDTHHITLGRFTKTESTQLVQNMLGQVGQKSHILRLLDENAEGNAFFMIDLIQSVSETVPQLDHLDQIKLPDRVISRGVQDIALRRLARIPQAYQPMLRLASVMGHEIDFALLKHIDDDFDYDEWLQLCADAAILSIQDGRWRFTHDRLRAGILTLLAEDELPHLHTLAAQAIEAVYPNQVAYAFGLLEHWHLAGNIEKEASVLQILGRNIVTYTPEYERARQLLDRTLNRLPNNHPARPALLNIYAVSYWRQGKLDEASHYANQAYSLAHAQENSTEVIRSLISLGAIHRHHGDFVRAEAYYQQVLKLTPPTSNEAGLVLGNLAVVVHYQGDIRRAHAIFEQAIAISNQNNDTFSTAIRMANFASLLLSNGDTQTAYHYLSDAVAILQPLGALLPLAYAYSNLGDCLILMGVYDKALIAFQDSLEIKYRIADAPWSMAHTQLRIGMTHITLNDSANAHIALQEALSLAEQSKQQRYIIEIVVCFAHLYYHMNRQQEAYTLIRCVNKIPNPAPNIRQRIQQLPFSSPEDDSGDNVSLDEVIQTIIRKV